MSIQGSINQLLTTTAVLAKLDPKSEERAEQYKAKQVLKKVAEQRKAAFGTYSGDKEVADKGITPEQKAIDVQTEELGVSAAEKLYNLDPNEENRKALEKSKKRLARTEAIPANTPLTKALEIADKAEQSLAARQDQMRPKTKRSFKNVQVDFGDGSVGTVRDLPKSWQKQISEQLKPEQRKKLIAQTEPKENK